MKTDFYVYAHRKLTDGKIFYVGKGRGNRMYVSRGRSQHWTRIARKHGFKAEVLAGSLNENLAFFLEKMFIRELGRTTLCNATDGGEGLSGYIPSKTTIESLRASSTGRVHGDQAKAKIAEAQSVRTYCSNGMIFQSATSAASWLRSIGHVNARQSLVSRAACGERNLAYGYAWSYSGVPGINIDEINRTKRIRQSEAKKGVIPANAKPIICSNGMSFHSSGAAAIWLKNNGFPKADKSAIRAAVLGRKKTAYGLSWHEAKI